MIKYGYKYCNFFLVKYYEKFSDKGKEWATKTGLCLQKQLNNIPDSIACKKIKKFAMQGHLDCVIPSGYCDLTPKDKKLIFKIVAKNPNNWLRGLKYLKMIKKNCLK